jgi:hypothetical protein
MYLTYNDTTLFFKDVHFMYTYSALLGDIRYLNKSGIEVGSIGLSALGNSIPYVHVGEYSGAQVIITGGIHARENVTCLLAMRQAYRLAFFPRALEGGVYFVPMVNPDGALLIEKGAEWCGERHAAFLRGINGGDDDFSLWKANANGVDLNNNFDALFGEGVYQRTSPAPQGYHGEYAFSEPETRALKNFTLRVAPRLTLSYHALGREIYWYFFQGGAALKRDKKIAERVEAATRYRRVDGAGGSTGGYKDWCVQSLKIPALTLEIISESKSHPLSLSDLEDDWDVNKDMPYLLLQAARESG